MNRKILTIFALAITLLLSSCAAPAAGTTDAPVKNTYGPIVVTDEYKAPESILMEIKARLLHDEDRDWQDELTVHDGDTVEIMAQYANYTDKDHSRVCVGFNLPDELEYVDQTFLLANYLYPEGIRFKGSINSINIGEYPGVKDATAEGDPGSNAFCYIQLVVHADTAKTLPIQFIATCNGSDDTVVIADSIFNLEIE